MHVSDSRFLRSDDDVMYFTELFGQGGQWTATGQQMLYRFAAHVAAARELAWCCVMCESLDEVVSQKALTPQCASSRAHLAARLPSVSPASAHTTFIPARPSLGSGFTSIRSQVE